MNTQALEKQVARLQIHLAQKEWTIKEYQTITNLLLATIENELDLDQETVDQRREDIDEYRMDVLQGLRRIQ